MKKTFAQSIICSILALSASPLTFAEVYNYVGKETYYSLDDPNSWSPKGGSSGSYEWINGQTLIFDSNTNAGAANQVAVKYLKDGDTPDIEEIIFKTTTNVQASSSSDTTPYTSIKVGKVTVYAGTEDKLSTFSKITLGEVSIGADSETPVSKTTILSTSFNNNGNDYFYNSATDNSISADIGRVTLNGAVPTNPNDQNTTLWYINNQSSASANYKSGVILVNGIGGIGTVRNNFGDNVEGSTTLVFTNTSDASFKGVLMDDWDAPSKLAKITVIMDGAENATQTIRQVSTSPSGVWNRNDLDSVGTIIKNGTLAVSTAGDVELSRVKLEGGALAVATRDDAGVGGQGLVTLVIGVDAQRRIAQNGLGARRSHDEVLVRPLDRIAQVVELAVRLLEDHLFVRQRGPGRGIPVDHAHAAVDAPLAVEVAEDLDDPLGADVVHRETGAVPVARSPQLAQLPQNYAAVLLLPCPGTL